jgi:hypothetical protein
LTNGRKIDDSNLIELSEFSNQINLNTDTTISKSILKEKQGLLKVDLEKLYRDYFSDLNFKDFTISKIERMYNDFKIFLRLIESFKQN